MEVMSNSRLNLRGTRAESVPGSGFPEIVKRNPHESIQGKDVVFWHVFGITHIPRAEDFPIMPIEETGFIFRPHNFFTQNPSLRHGVTSVLPRG